MSKRAISKQNYSILFESMLQEIEKVVIVFRNRQITASKQQQC